MDIPEKIALQGVSVINEYKEKHELLDVLEHELFDISTKLGEVESDIYKWKNEWHWNKRNSYYKDWKERKTMERHWKLRCLTSEHEKLTYQFIDLDNQYTSLNLEMYQKGWLPDWKMKEMKNYLD